MSTGEFHNNDVDALRHAYVSGVFTMEYNATVAKILGDLNEIFPHCPYNRNTSPEGGERDMDDWNNRIGREHGEKPKTREELFEGLKKALKNGDLIVRPEDPRKNSSTEGPVRESVVVLKESETGENLSFLDVKSLAAMSREEFVSLIKAGKYRDYEIRNIGGKEIPASKRDGKGNLG